MFCKQGILKKATNVSISHEQSSKLIPLDMWYQNSPFYFHTDISATVFNFASQGGSQLTCSWKQVRRGVCVISYQLVARAPKDLPCPLRSPRSSEVSLGPVETSKTQRTVRENLETLVGNVAPSAVTSTILAASPCLGGQHLGGTKSNFDQNQKGWGKTIPPISTP